MKKNLLYFLCLFLIHFSLFGQESSSLVTISGKVIDAETNIPLEYATVAFKKVNDSILKGTTTNKKGRFKLKIATGNYSVKISFLSFKTHEITSLELTDNFNLGVIALQPDTKLDEVEIVAEKKIVEVKFNKRIYNASADVANAGGNALDVLSNTPSVRVSQEGIITVRGGSATVLIDGKPQLNIDNNVDILKAIPSNSIDKVEIISRSAKYSAEGGGVILNIITKKRQGKGFSGSLEAHTGIPDNHGVSAFLNEDTDKINLYTTISYNHQDNLKTVGFDQSLLNLNENNNEGNLKNSFLFNLGSDFYINKKNTINTSFLVNLNHKNITSDITATDFTRKAIDKEDVSRIEAQLGYTTQLNEEGQKLVFSFNYQTTFSNSKAAINEAQFPTTTIFQKTSKDQHLNSFIAQVDYSLPISETNSLEFGYKGAFRKYENKFNVGQFNSATNDFDVINNLDDTINFDEFVHGFYGLYNGASGKFEYSVGLRTEISDVTTKKLKTNDLIKRNYTDLFPSFSVGFAASDASYLSFGYSRFIERPNIPQINPFISFSDQRFQSIGNLNLNPFYNDYIELLFDTSFGKILLTSALFANLNQNHFLKVLENTGLQTTNGDAIFTRRFINSGDQNLIGIDADIYYSPFKWLRLNAYISPYQNKITNAINSSYNVENNVLYTRGGALFKLNNGLKLNFAHMYQTSIKNGLREQKPLSWSQLVVSKDLFKKKAMITFKANDLFGSKRGEIISFESNTRTVRTVFFENQFNLSFTYRFNQKRQNSKNRSNEINKDDLEDKQDKKF